MKNDTLGDRMKGYENAYRFYLPRRLPVIIRVDGRAFHTFTKGFGKPFDRDLMDCMQYTAVCLCEEISGCKLAYVQSDEISLLVTNDDTLDTQPWFDNNLQKLVSLTASIATKAFNRRFRCRVSLFDSRKSAKFDSATFDSRAFVLPKEEVTNYFIWRQQDATRNSIQMVAQSLYSHKELQGKNSFDLQEMIHEKGVNWNDYSVPCKRGACVTREGYNSDGVIRHEWLVDWEIPVFTKDRDYIEKRLNHEESDR